jgi:hypothetical protein
MANVTSASAGARHGLGGLGPGHRHDLLSGLRTNIAGAPAGILEVHRGRLLGRRHDSFGLAARLRDQACTLGVCLVQQCQYRQQFRSELTVTIGGHRGASGCSRGTGWPETVKKVAQLGHQCS